MKPLVAPCSPRAARYAVEHWYRTPAFPSGPTAQHGVWEDGRFVGALVYGRGVSYHLGTAWGLHATECCELLRVAFRQHQAPISQCLTASLHALSIANPGLRAVFTFADPDAGHHGGIYQAANWFYLGTTAPSRHFVIHGRVRHARSVSAMRSAWRARHGTTGDHLSLPDWLRAHIDPHAAVVPAPGKHRYAFAFDKQACRRLRHAAQPYPRGRGVDGDAPAPHAGEAGSTPADRSAPRP